MKVIYHPAALQQREEELTARESDLQLKIYLNNIDRQILENERKNILKIKRSWAVISLVSFLLGFLTSFILIPAYL